MTAQLHTISNELFLRCSDQRKTRWNKSLFWFGSVHSFNGISNYYELFNDKIWLSFKYWIVFMTIFSMFYFISICNRTIWFIYGTLTGTIISGLSEPLSNSELTPHFRQLQKWSLITRFSIVSYPRHLFFCWGTTDNLHNYIECHDIHMTHVIANNSTNNNVVFFFCFRFENSIL